MALASLLPDMHWISLQTLPGPIQTVSVLTDFLSESRALITLIRQARQHIVLPKGLKKLFAYYLAVGSYQTLCLTVSNVVGARKKQWHCNEDADRRRSENSTEDE